MKQVLVIVIVLVLAAALYVGGMILFAIITQYNPAPVETVELVKPKSENPNSIIGDSTFSFMIWNVGYGGLGAEVDFFYDGGKMVTSPEKHVLKNNAGMVEFLSSNKDIDFIFLQETDRDSKRSWGIDQVEQFATVLPEYNYAFTPNYDVKWLPFPFTDPMGKVYGGLSTFSKYTPVETQRIAIANITDFPRKLFYLKRCLMTQRYKLPNGKDLFIINTHFEAYDAKGEVKKLQMAKAKEIMEAEYAKGNYVVIGGDWNIAPPAFDINKWEKVDDTEGDTYRATNDSTYIPGWKYAYDESTPTNRDNKHAYDPATTYTTVIDYFFVSPNIEVEEVKNVDMQFKYSDHNPVKLKVRLK